MGTGPERRAEAGPGALLGSGPEAGSRTGADGDEGADPGGRDSVGAEGEGWGGAGTAGMACGPVVRRSGTAGMACGPVVRRSGTAGKPCGPVVRRSRSGIAGVPVAGVGLGWGGGPTALNAPEGTRAAAGGIGGTEGALTAGGTEDGAPDGGPLPAGPSREGSLPAGPLPAGPLPDGPLPDGRLDEGGDIYPQSNTGRVALVREQRGRGQLAACALAGPELIERCSRSTRSPSEERSHPALPDGLDILVADRLGPDDLAAPSG